eukprot:s75_g35.t3
MGFNRIFPGFPSILPWVHWAPLAVAFPLTPRTARPSQITAQLRRSIAERLERHLDFASAAEFGDEVRSQIGPCPFWCTEEASQALETLLAPLRATESNQEAGESLRKLELRRGVALEVPIADELKAALPAAYSDAQVIPYGSIISRFAARDADADAGGRAGCIQGVLWLLSRGHDVSAIGLGGRVPVLTLRWGHSKSRTADVTIGNRLGIYKSLLLREYSLLDERLCDLVLAVKRWAKLREISGQTRGYPGGYAWTLMAIAFAQSKASPALVPSLQALAEPEIWEEDEQRYNVAWSSAEAAHRCAASQSSWTSASLLCAFFEFFSERFDFIKDSASVRLGCHAVKASSSSSSPRLSLEDPIETDWDLGHILSAHRLCRLRAELRRARRRLRGAPDGCLEAVFQPRGKKCRR